MTLSEEYLQHLKGPWTNIQDCLERLYHTACRYPDVKVLELGLGTGESTIAFLAAAELMAGHVQSVDKDTYQVPSDTISRWMSTGYWTLTQGDDLVIKLPRRKPDVLFVDTSHTYEQTLAELRRYVPLVRKGGTVLCHDTRLGGHYPDMPQPQPDFPVAAALNTFCEETGLTWVDHDAQYGLGEILVPRG